MLLVDLEQSTNDLALGVEPDGTPVAIGPSASEAPRKHGRLHAADRFVDEVLQKNRTQKTGNGELDLIDMAFRHRVECDTVVHELLAQERDILRVSRQSIECLAHHHIDGAHLDVAQQLLQTGAIAPIARLLRIQVCGSYGAAEIVDQLHARRRLVRTRCGALHRRRMASI
nr:hypothetical protein [Sphingomonas carotinifaciens]